MILAAFRFQVTSQTEKDAYKQRLSVRELFDDQSRSLQTQMMMEVSTRTKKLANIQ